MKRLLRRLRALFRWMDRQHRQFSRAHAQAYPETSAWAKRENEAMDQPSPVPGLFSRK